MNCEAREVVGPGHAYHAQNRPGTRERVRPAGDMVGVDSCIASMHHASCANRALLLSLVHPNQKALRPPQATSGHLLRSTLNVLNVHHSIFIIDYQSTWISAQLRHAPRSSTYRYHVSHIMYQAIIYQASSFKSSLQLVHRSNLSEIRIVESRSDAPMGMVHYPPVSN